MIICFIIFIMAYIYIYPQQNQHSYGYMQKRADTLTHYLDYNHKVYYKINYENDSLYSIIWGKNGKSFQSKKYPYANAYGHHVPYLYSKNYLISEISCGTDCYYTLFLSMDGKVDKEYFYCFAYNLKKDLVAYVVYDDNYYGTYVIENLRTNKKLVFRLPGIGNDLDFMYTAVTKAIFRGEKLTVYYLAKDYKGEIKTKKITIDCDLE